MSFLDLFDKVTSNVLYSNDTDKRLFGSNTPLRSGSPNGANSFPNIPRFARKFTRKTGYNWKTVLHRLVILTAGLIFFSNVCESAIPNTSFHLWLLIPATLLILIQAFTIPRKSKLLNCCYGRPGIVFPMDILGSSNRLSYVAAWGSIAYLAAEMVVDQKFAIKLTGKYGTIFNAVLSMIIYGVDYFPLFAALAVESVLSYVVGSLYAWMLFAVNVYKDTECHFNTYQARLILILRDLPNFLCLGYLSISLPVRLIQAYRQHSLRYLHAQEMVSILNLKKDLNRTPETDHVRKLLRKPHAERDKPARVHSKIAVFFRNIIHDYIYHTKKNFRYSSRMLSVMFVGGLLLYKVTIEIVVFIMSVFTTIQKGFDATLAGIGLVYQEGESSTTTTLRTTTLTLYAVLNSGKICFIVSATIACASGYLTILHMLSRYRTNLFALYKGDSSFIPHRSTRGNASLLVGCMRYAGYQVGYIAWGFLIQFTILFLFTFVIATLITLIDEGFYKWILTILDGAWPAVLVTIFITVAQFLLAKLVFLQGNDLAIDNRRLLFCATFFFFFYNVFLGLLSCLLRIVKSVVIGALFMPRLDHSALSRRFEMMDPGFAAYVGFIQIESTHTNPVMIVFLRALMIDNMSRNPNQSTDDTAVIEIETYEKHHFNQNSSRTRARNRWQLMYTLYKNPGLRVYRKHYMTFIKDMRTKMAETNYLNNSDITNVIEGIEVAIKKNKLTENMDISSAEVIDFSKILAMARIFNNLSPNGTNSLTSNEFPQFEADKSDIKHNGISVKAGKWKLAAGKAYIDSLKDKTIDRKNHTGSILNSTHL